VRLNRMGDGYGEVPNCQPNGRITKVVKPNLNLQQNIVSAQRGEQYTTSNIEKENQCTQGSIEGEPMNPQNQKSKIY